MIPLDLSGAERRTFEAALLKPYEMRVRVRVLTLDGDELSEVTNRLLDGQVNIDTGAETTRQASLTLSDPNNTMNLDSDAPSDGALYVDRMINLHHEIYVLGLQRWVSVPIFTGPITSMTRDGEDITLSCLGKEFLAKGNCWRPLTLRKGYDTVQAIRTILRERAGETRFAFPDLARRLPRNVSLGRMTQPWAIASRLARSIDRQLYYDGEGVCRLRAYPHGSVYTFRDRGGAVLGNASVTFDITNVRNVVWVKGGKPKGAKKAVTWPAVAQPSHSLSPARQGRNQTPRFLVEEIDNDHVRTVKSARQIANNRLRQKLLEGVTVTFDALPIPHLDPLDVVRLSTELTSVTFTLRQASIPLTHDGVMTVGSNRRVSVRRQAIR